MKPIVLCDVDGVVADFVTEYCNEANFIADAGFTPKDVREWDIGKALGLTERQAFKVENNLGSMDRRLAMFLHPYPGAVDLIRSLAPVADVVFVTSPFSASPTWCHDRTVWLKEYFPDHKVIFTKHKQYVYGHYLIDDRPDNIESWRQTAWQYRAFSPSGMLIARPWNKGTLTLEDAVRIIIKSNTP